jgi:hypothetical protein
MDASEISYGLMRCEKKDCSYCHKSNISHGNESCLQFTDHYVHTFLNQYQVILNTNVTCSSSNIIYTLTCSCEQYDYVGRTHGQFYQRLNFHRRQCTRLLVEFLLGEQIVSRNNALKDSLNP